MKCSPIKTNSNHWHCPRCGYISKQPSDKPFHKECTPGLGDKVQATLSFFGITKARVNWVKRMFGSKKPCGCSQRQEYLNNLGDSIGL